MPPVRIAVLGLLLASCLTPHPAPAQTLEIIARNLANTYEALHSFTVTVKYDSRFADGFLEYRKAAGMDLKVKSQSFSALVTYFAKEDLFGNDQKSWNGDGSVAYDMRQAWDGVQWQCLHRTNPDNHWFGIARRRNGAHEASAQIGSPLQMGFPYLISGARVVTGGDWPADDYLWKATLDKMHDKKAWQAFAQRLKGIVYRIKFEGQDCWLFNVTSGSFDGDDLYTRIWLPVDAPVYPIRFELHQVRGNRLLGSTQVTRFFDAVDIGAERPLRFPRTVYTENFTDDPNWSGKPYSTVNFEYLEFKFNPPLTGDDFKVDPSSATAIQLLDTQKWIHPQPKVNHAVRKPDPPE